VFNGDVAKDVRFDLSPSRGFRMLTAGDTSFAAGQEIRWGCGWVGAQRGWPVCGAARGG
jgi:hypothetical protein